MFGNGLTGKTARKLFSHALTVVALVSLAACGGGSFNDSDAVAAPTAIGIEVTSIAAAPAASQPLKVGESVKFTITGKKLATVTSIAEENNDCDVEAGSVVATDTSITFNCTPSWYGVSFVVNIGDETAGPVAYDFPNPHVTFVTSAGSVEIELDAKAAPKTVRNFLQYAYEGHYDNTIFHQVFNGGSVPQVVRGGTLLADFSTKTGAHPEIPEVLDERKFGGVGLSNVIDTIAMQVPAAGTDTSEFFFNLADNRDSYDWKSQADAGYVVFGHIVSGNAIVKGIQTAAVNTGTNVPTAPVTINSVTLP